MEIATERRQGSELFDATSLLVLPGMVDTHVHLMDPASPDREDFPSGTAHLLSRPARLDRSGGSCLV